MTEQPQPLSTRSAGDGATPPEQGVPKRRRLFGIFGSGRRDKVGSIKPISSVPAAGSDSSGALSGKSEKSGGEKPAAVDETKVGEAATVRRRP